VTAKVQRFDVLCIQMMGDKVTVIEGPMKESLAKVVVDRIGTRHKKLACFHDYCPAGSYKTGQKFEGNRR
jgi:hypothetical protein